MRLTIAEEAALEEWCLAMYRWGSPVRLDILRCMVAAILEDRERRNIESAPDFFQRIMDPDLRDCTSLDVEGKIKAPDTSRIGHNWYKRFLTRHPAPKPVNSRALDHERAMNNLETITQYFNVLKSTMKEFNIKPQNIYNMDEKGFLIGVIKKSMCVLIEASEKAAFLRQPGDRENITVIETVGIFNQDMPPMVILKGAHQYPNTKKSSSTWEVSKDDYGSGSDSVRDEPAASAAQPQERKGLGPWSTDSTCRQGDKSAYC